MITRILPRQEYYRLEGTELEAVRSTLPAAAQVLVVEDDGRIVACWSLMPVWHVEGVWIAPEQRGRLGVVRRLVAGMFGLARSLGAGAVLTAAMTPEVEDLCRRLGGVEIPGKHFSLCVDANNRGK